MSERLKINRGKAILAKYIFVACDVLKTSVTQITF